MSRATPILAGTTLLGLAASVYLFLENRSLREDLADPPAQVAQVDGAKAAERGEGDAWLDARPRDGSSLAAAMRATPAPSLPPAPKESRMDRRARRTLEFAAMFGRHDGETEDEYRARIMPLIEMGLSRPRSRVAEMRKVAEEKAKVTPEQSARLDQAFEKVYDDVLDYTNKAIIDGQLSPYERNVAGWLDYAGGLGGLLTEANGQIGKILDPGQLQAMSAAGFEWGEYLGMTAPWEKLTPPPPRK